MTAKRLADFLADVSAHEEILTQRLRDLEARDVLVRMEGGQARPAESKPEHLRKQEPNPPLPEPPSLDDRKHDMRQPGGAEEQPDVYADLDLYGEYRS